MLIADANRYFAGEEPWLHKKTNPKRMETILYATAEVTRQIAILVQPVMPKSAGRLARSARRSKEDRIRQALPKRRLTPGTELPAPQAVFPRHVEAEENPAA